MKAAVFAMLLLLASGASVHGRKLLQDGCADLSALTEYPQVSDIITLAKGFGLLPSGLPSNVTIFLPSNDAVAALIASVAPILPGATAENLPTLVAGLPSALGVTPRLISALLYHISLIGPQDPESLLAEGTIPTALEGYDLKFAEAPGGNYTVTTTGGDVANVEGEPISVCGSEVYVVDKVLTPAQILDPTFPLTTLDEALAILGQEPAAAAPAPEAASP